MKLSLLTCRAAMARLYEYIDDDLESADERAVKAHLRLCQACARRFRFEERLLAQIRERCRAPQASGELKRRIETILELL